MLSNWDRVEENFVSFGVRLDTMRWMASHVCIIDYVTWMLYWWRHIKSSALLMRLSHSYIDDVTWMLYWWRHIKSSALLMRLGHSHIDDVTGLPNWWRHITASLMTSHATFTDNAISSVSLCRLSVPWLSQLHWWRHMYASLMTSWTGLHFVYYVLHWRTITNFTVLTLKNRATSLISMVMRDFWSTQSGMGTNRLYSKPDLILCMPFFDFPSSQETF